MYFAPSNLWITSQADPKAVKLKIFLTEIASANDLNLFVYSIIARLGWIHFSFKSKY